MKEKEKEKGVENRARDEHPPLMPMDAANYWLHGDVEVKCGTMALSYTTPAAPINSKEAAQYRSVADPLNMPSVARSSSSTNIGKKSAGKFSSEFRLGRELDDGGEDEMDMYILNPRNLKTIMKITFSARDFLLRVDKRNRCLAIDCSDLGIV